MIEIFNSNRLEDFSSLQLSSQTHPRSSSFLVKLSPRGHSLGTAKRSHRTSPKCWGLAPTTWTAYQQPIGDVTTTTTTMTIDEANWRRHTQWNWLGEGSDKKPINIALYFWSNCHKIRIYANLKDPFGSPLATHQHICTATGAHPLQKLPSSPRKGSLGLGESPSLVEIMMMLMIGRMSGRSPN